MPASDQLAPGHGLGFYPGISILRALAAGLVLLQHATFLGSTTASVNDFPNLRFSSGEIGIVMFFCISGFVIGLQRHSTPTRFFARRLLRIYPPFWIACAISVGLSVAFMDGQARVGLTSMLLLPSTQLNNSLNIPYWTLIFEVVFYAIVGLMMVARLSDRAIAAICWAWILIVQLAAPHFADAASAKAPGLLIVFDPYVQLFALGLLACLNLQRLERLPDAILCIVGVAGFTIVASFPLPFPLIVLLWGISLTSIVIFSLRLQRAPALLNLLGDASYGLYLIHLPVLFLLVQLFAGTSLPASYLVPLFFVIAGASGVLFGAAEFHLHRRLTARLFGSRKVAAPLSPAQD